MKAGNIKGRLIEHRWLYTKAISKTELRRTIVKLIDPAKLLAELLIARYLPVTFVVTVASGSVMITVEA